ncbi:elongation factor P 5-aminopentanone reductase [Alicyclobacillus dauci]|uniref:SDR family oxidoreductase n=1 Tax=Alicyclobacillus dauci TaxID=1475485 RepID=A0ABY6ZAE6_9BACL|nr:SDR family oxidoreductase [Alicyclobacillus dauci]WAH39231.1 SDR family oxidoreductase [Alicyclobacillus dauci]
MSRDTHSHSHQTLQGRVAIVTGASRGIGRSIAIELASAGASLVVNFRQNQDLAEEVVEQCRSHDVQAIAVQADTSDEKAVKHLLMSATELGIPDILVNNAGVSHYGLLMDMSLETWKSVIDVNLTSSFLCTREAIPLLRRNGRGRIINIASIHGLSGASCEAAYAASKAGVIALTKSLAQELGSLGITVNAIAPGVIDTDMMASFSREEREAMVDETPLNRLGHPTDVAAIVRFLASDEAGFITGQTIRVDGGRIS